MLPVIGLNILSILEALSNAYPTGSEGIAIPMILTFKGKLPSFCSLPEVKFTKSNSHLPCTLTEAIG